MKKLISTVLLAALFLTGCEISKFPPKEDSSEGSEPTPPEDNAENGTSQDSPYTPPTLIVPEYRDYGRGTVNFSEITYKRPDMEAAISEFSALSDMIDENAQSFELQLSGIKETDNLFFEISSMYTYLNIMTKSDVSDSYWSTEFSYVSVSYPRFAKAVEDLFVACASSPHKDKFEDEYFGAGALSEYEGGGKYTDSAIELMAREAELEANYSGITPSSITLSYGGMNGTLDYLVSYYDERYGKSEITEALYLYHVFRIDGIYREEYAKLTKPIFTELIKTRFLIADALEYDSYTEYAYELTGHDYSADVTMRLLSDIADTLIPLYYRLYTEIFKNYNAPSTPAANHKNEILNTLYSVLEKTDTELFEAFCYMLQHGLYDVEPSSSKRYDGAFTAYIEKHRAPFIFVSTTGDAQDYFTVIHEFGHFYDAYVNDGTDASLDLSEISSQALEMLLLEGVEEALPEEYENYLLVKQIDDVLGTIRAQSFFSMVEHEIYGLEYDGVTEENINSILKRCEEKFYYAEGTFTLNDIVRVPHLVLYPSYVQSYVTSALVSLEIYFAEKDSEGAGLEAYRAIVSKDSDSTFSSELYEVGLSTPFESGFIKETVNRIHRLIYGSDYYKDTTLPDVA